MGIHTALASSVLGGGTIGLMVFDGQVHIAFVIMFSTLMVFAVLGFIFGWLHNKITLMTVSSVVVFIIGMLSLTFALVSSSSDDAVASSPVVAENEPS